MYIEEFLLNLNYKPVMADIQAKDSWAHTFINSIIEKYNFGKPLSQRQRDVVIQTLIRHKDLILRHDPTSPVESVISSASFKSKLYITVAKNEIRYIGANKIAIRFKQNSSVNKDTIKNIGLPELQQVSTSPGQALYQKRTANYNVMWLGTHKVWVVNINNATAVDILNIIADEKTKFEVDKETMDALDRATSPTEEVCRFELMDDGIYCEIEDNPVVDSWIVYNLGAEIL